MFDLKSVSQASVVTLYLFPEINLKLMPMLKKTLKPGSRIVSHDFNMGDWKPTQELTMKVTGDRDHTIYLWVIPDPNKKVTPKKDEPKKETPKKDEPKKTDPLPLPKVVDPKKETPKKDEPKKEPFETIKVPYVPRPKPLSKKCSNLPKSRKVTWCGISAAAMVVSL